MRDTSNVLRIFKTLYEHDCKNNSTTNAVMIRFCDENAAHLSFAFNNLDK